MFHLSNNPTTWCLYAVVMGLVSLLTFGNLLTQDFWDGADDQSIIADIAILSQDLSYIISPQRSHDARPPFDLVMLGGYLIWGENPAAFHTLHITLHLLASLLVAFTLYHEKQAHNHGPLDFPNDLSKRATCLGDGDRRLSSGWNLNAV